MTVNLSRVTRVQIRDMTVGGSETQWLGVTARFVLTDEGRTLKVIIDRHPVVTAEAVKQEMRSGWAKFFQKDTQ